MAHSTKRFSRVSWLMRLCCSGKCDTKRPAPTSKPPPRQCLWGCRKARLMAGTDTRLTRSTGTNLCSARNSDLGARIKVSMLRSKLSAKAR
jgi:hypothetical protein